MLADAHSSDSQNNTAYIRTVYCWDTGTIHTLVPTVERWPMPDKDLLR